MTAAQKFLLPFDTRQHVLGGLSVVLWLLAISLGSENFSAFAENTDAKPVDQQSTGPNSASRRPSTTLLKRGAYSMGWLVNRNAFG
jgi:hypothetical protein